MPIKSISLILGVLAAFLVFTQVSANTAIIYGFLAGWTLFASTKVFRHVSTTEDYRLNGDGFFWVEFFTFTIAVACSFAIAGKLLIA